MICDTVPSGLSGSECWRFELGVRPHFGKLRPWEVGETQKMAGEQQEREHSSKNRP